MSKKRMVDTRFWHDNWIRKLNALERYLFLYLLTNDKCSFCGVYELPLSVMAFESGIDEHDLETALLPKLEPKIYYKNGWVFLINFDRYHVNDSPNNQKGYNSALEELPQEILNVFKGLKGASRVSDTSASASASASALAFASAPSGATPSVAGIGGEKINKIIESFKPINPSYKNLYSNKTERAALERLVKEHGEEHIVSLIGFLPKIIVRPYAPRITTPYQLEKKMGELKVFIGQEQNKSKKTWTII